MVSAYFILSANSWMQHPVGVSMVDGRPRLTSISAVLFNNTALAAIPHTIAGAFAVGGAFLVGIAAWKLRRQPEPAWRASLKLGVWVGVVAFAALLITGDRQGKLMFQQQPMKMAAAEALCHTEQPASFSIFAYGDVDRPDCENVKSITVPALLSFLAKGDLSSKVAGVNDLIGEYKAKYGTTYPVDPRLGELSGKPIDYVPNLPVTYWGFRLMIGFGALATLIGLGALWLTRRGRVPASPWFTGVALAGLVLPFLGNSFGWIFTEMGRQPFVVAPNPSRSDGVWMFTAQGVSGLTAGEVLATLIALCTVYTVLAVVEVFLIVRVVRGRGGGARSDDEPSDQLELAY
jgi:cytochrome d ubiquinol oxidase subunit I